MLLLNAVNTICDQNPLGSAAGYGSSFPIDRDDTTAALGSMTPKINVVAAQMSRETRKNLAQAITVWQEHSVDFRWMFVCT